MANRPKSAAKPQRVASANPGPETITRDEFLAALLPPESLNRRTLAVGDTCAVVSTPWLPPGEKMPVWPPKAYQSGRVFDAELYVNWATCLAVEHTPTKGRRAGQTVIEPRATNEAFDRQHFLMLDDIGNPEKSCLTLDDPRVQGATYLIETSAGNYQVGYALNTPLDYEQNAQLRASCVAAGLGDEGALASPHRWARVPGSVNMKPGKNGWKSVLRAWHPERRFSLDELAALLGLDLTVEPLRAKRGNGSFEMPDDVGKYQDLFFRWMLTLPKGEPGSIIGPRSSSGYFEIQCPWHDEHSETPEAGYLPAFGDQPFGFRCLHSHGLEPDRSHPAFLGWCNSHPGYQAFKAAYLGRATGPVATRTAAPAPKVPPEAAPEPLSDAALIEKYKDRGEHDGFFRVGAVGSAEWLKHHREKEQAGDKAEAAARRAAARAEAAFSFLRPVEEVMRAEFEPVDPIIDGLLYPKGLTMFYGKQKEGKSFALMQAMHAASSGVPLWRQVAAGPAMGLERFQGFTVPQPVACLMLCAEDYGGRLQKRFRELRERSVLPHNVTRFDLLLREDLKKLADAYRDGEGQFVKPGIEIVEELIRQWATVFKVIALDTVATIEQVFDVEHPGKDVKKREYAMGTFYDALADELGIAIVGTGHMRKGRGKTDDGLSPMDLVNTTGAANAGISHFWALVRLAEQLEVLDEDSRGKERMFFATGREIEDDPKLHLRQGEDGFGGLWVNYGTVADVHVGARCGEILAALEGLWLEKPGPYTTKAIAAVMEDGTTPKAVQRMLHRFAKRGQPWKHWRLERRLGPKGGWTLVE